MSTGLKLTSQQGAQNMKTAIDILKEAFKARGYGGLYNPQDERFCAEVDEYMCIKLTCLPGVKVPGCHPEFCTKDYGPNCPFHIAPKPEGKS